MPQPPRYDAARASWAAAHLTDPGTDPSGARRFDALYRESAADAPWRGPAVRHYEPTLRPPEHTGDDPFGWLFRDSSDSAASPVMSSPPPVSAPAVPPRGVPLAAAVPEVESRPELVGAADHPQRRPGRLLVALLALLAIVVGAGAGAFIETREHRTVRSDGAPSASVPDPGSTTGLVPVGADADCQAPPATDDAGQPVDYGPQQLFDGQPSTGWRCDGSAVGRSVTFRFASTAGITEVGLLNGYPKVDPASGVERYGEYRRVTAVTWTFPDGATFHQVLADGVQTVQTMPIPAQQASQVTMTIDTTTMPGLATTSPGARHDAVVLAEATFGAVG